MHTSRIAVGVRQGSSSEEVLLRSSRKGKKAISGVLAFTLAASWASFAPQALQEVPAANASTPANSVALYLSAPMVQGPSVLGSNFLIETFNAKNGVPISGFTSGCGTLEIATVEVGSGAQCNYYTPISDPWGGASTTTSTPTFNLTAQDTMTPYGQVSGGKVTFTLDQPAQYVGFWWTSGGAGNSVNFLDQNNVSIAAFTSGEIDTRLNISPLLSVNSTTYQRSFYLGHPAGHVSSTPSVNSRRPPHLPAGGWDTGAQYAYLNVYAGGNVAVKKIEFTADPNNGFEFDNLTVSTDIQTPLGSMIKIAEKTSQAPANPAFTVSFDANAGTGSAVAQTRRTSGSLVTNGFTRVGHTFAGWNTAANGSGTAYANGATFPFSASTTLFAQWATIPDPVVAPAVTTPPATNPASTTPVATAPVVPNTALATTGTEVSLNVIIFGGALLTAGLGLVLLARRLRAKKI